MFRVVDHVRSSLWFVPVVCVFAGVALSFGTIGIDCASTTSSSRSRSPVVRRRAGDPVHGRGVDGSLTALVLTITMVVVQLAMGQFSPRIVQTILQDKPSQFAIGLFVATFAHAMLAMREVASRDPVAGQVPGSRHVVASSSCSSASSCWSSTCTTSGSRCASRRSSSWSARTPAATRHGSTRQAGPRGADGGGDRAPTRAWSPTSTTTGSSRAAREADCFLRAGARDRRVRAGRRRRCCACRGDPRPSPRTRLTDAIVLGLERTLDQDVAYGFRLLVDIAERSLADSPFLDPTTAVQAIDRLHDCCVSSPLGRSPTACIATRPARSVWSCRPWLGGLRPPRLRQRSAKSAPARPRWHAGFARRSRTCVTTPCPIAWR